MKTYQPFVGFEIHIELATKTKMFCSCLANHFGKPANSQVCPICLGMPGVLPAANQKAIEWTVMAGLALGCQIPFFSQFDRKHYFYPDLPKGYQISQYHHPLCLKGQLGKVGIREVHLEEDTAKMIHQREATLIDFNRSGVPLIEVVTDPDFRSGTDATIFLKKLQQIIRYLGISDGDMEKGSMRCEANVSVGISALQTTKKAKLPDYKVEVKNLNSFRFVKKAVDFEIERQFQLIKAGKKPIQETRGWNEIKQKTYSQRTKETAPDYRYFPEPDIPPIHWTKKQIAAIKSQLPELPAQKVSRWQKELKLSRYQAEILATTRQKAEYFEDAVKAAQKYQLAPQEIAKAIINKRVPIDKLLPADLVRILLKKQIKPTMNAAKMKVIISQIFKKHPQAVADFKKGKTQSLEFLLGQVMRVTNGNADPALARKMIVVKLG